MKQLLILLAKSLVMAVAVAAELIPFILQGLLAVCVVILCGARK